MMAVTQSNNIELVRYIFSKTKHGEADLMSVQNHSGDTVLSLVYGHGQVEIFQDLLDRHHVKVAAPDIDRCKKLKQISEAYIAQQRQEQQRRVDGDTRNFADDLDTLEQRKSQVDSCLDLLQRAYSLQQELAEQEAIRKMKELLQLEDNDRMTKKREDDHTNRGKKKKKKSSTEKYKDAQGKFVSENTDSQEGGKDGGNLSRSKSASPQVRINDATPVSAPRFVTLPNGSIVCDKDSTAAHSMKEGESEDVLNGHQTFTRTYPSDIHAMFMERCPEAESLCLDVSMLLLSPHKMAMLLSPCQLESIKRLLHEQLDSVHEAQCIKTRVWHGLNESITCQRPEDS